MKNGKKMNIFGGAPICWSKYTTPEKYIFRQGRYTGFVAVKSINIHGGLFDSKLQWADNIAHTLKRSTKALNAIRLIRKSFRHSELKLS